MGQSIIQKSKVLFEVLIFSQLSKALHVILLTVHVVAFNYKALCTCTVGLDLGEHQGVHALSPTPNGLSPDHCCFVLDLYYR